MQTINGNPTMFVSPNDFFNTTIEGRFTVQGTSDDDYIGFVFGYQSPTTNSGAATDNDFEFILFDWKQATQSFGGTTAQEGFNLVNLDGTFTTGSGLTGDNLPINHYFWQHADSGPSPANGGLFDVWGTDYGSTRGWADNTTYDFTLLYTSDQIKIDIEGGTGDFVAGQTIFDIVPADVGLAEFSPGRFGFYNYSQDPVRYESFTLTEPELSTVPGDGGTLDFLARAGDSAALTVNVSNSGGAGSLLTGTAGAPSGAPFSGPVEAANFSLSDGQDTDFTYNFVPSARGMFTDSIQIQSNEDATHTIDLDGIAVGPVFDSSVAPGTTIDLGVTQPSTGTDSSLQIANVTPDDNGGNDELTDLMLDFILQGGRPDLFSVDLVPGDIVSKGGMLDILVSFAGSAVPGTYTTTLNLLTDENAAFGDTAGGQSYNFDLTVTVVPEPVSLVLVALGSLGLLASRHRRVR